MQIDPRRIPIIGHDIYQVGQVYNIVSQPCSPDPWIAVTAFWAYTPQLLWSLVKPDWGDMTFNRAGRTHTRRRFARLRLDGAMKAPAPKSPGVALILFSGYQIAERVGWYLVVADATTDFLVNWTSMTYAYSGCKAGPASTGWFKSPGHRLGITEPGGWLATSGTEYWQESPVAASDGALQLTKSVPHTIRATVVGHTDEWGGNNGGLIAARLVRKRGGVVEHLPLSQSWDQEGKASYSTADAHTHTYSAGWIYQLETQWGGGVAYVDHLHVELTAAPSAGVEGDP